MNAINNSSRLNSLEQYNKYNKNNRFSKNDWDKTRITLKKFIENNTNMRERYPNITRAPRSTIFQKK
jgi:pullulanase/glycogen debranching enzyme